MKSCLYFVILLLLVNLLGCKPAQPKQTTVTGQIFIVTGNAENIRLGAVEVFLIEKPQAIDFLKKRQLAIESKIASRQQELANAVFEFTNQPALMVAIADVEKAEGDYKSFITNESVYTFAKAEEKLAAMEAAKSRLAETMRPIRSHLERLQSRVVTATTLLQEASAKPSAETYFANFSPPFFKKTISDADGKFYLTCPIEKQFTIFTSGQRTVLDKTEKYYWIVDVPVNVETAQLLLNNHNLVFADPDGYFKLKLKQVE